MLAQEQNQYKYLLKEGDAVIFDNRRVLHARTAFSDLENDPGQSGKDGETNRWLKGCYLEADAPLDRGRVLRKAHDGNQG
jgi:gamma-butyrobetaine dioxygenase